jgi:ABC-type transport system substrate-binding protein
MKMNIGRATKTSMFMAVFLAFLMLGLPSFGTGHQVANGAVDQASAAAGSRTIYIGWVGMRDSVATLNPLLYTMAGEMSVIWPCYSFLTQYDIDGQTRIGDLAKSWSVAPDGLTWHFSLYNSASFYDRLNPGVSHPLTADDVMFTYYLCQNQTGNFLQSYFPKIDVGGVMVPMIDSMWKVGDYELYVKTVVPYGPFLSSTGSIPILPKYLWEPRILNPNQYGKYGGWNWPNFDPNNNVPPIVGSGAYYFMENGLTTAGDYRLGKNPNWFATKEYGWTLRNNVLYYKSETSTTSNYNDYKAGAVDVMIGVTPAQYLSVTDPLEAYGVKFAQSTGFVYEFNINGITPALRDQYGISPQLGGKDNPILQDPVFKLAMAMSINKQGFVDDSLRGLGRTADSLVPDASPWHYWYGLQPGEDPTRPGRAPVGEEPVTYDGFGLFNVQAALQGRRHPAIAVQVLDLEHRGRVGRGREVHSQHGCYRWYRLGDSVRCEERRADELRLGPSQLRHMALGLDVLPGV